MNSGNNYVRIVFLGREYVGQVRFIECTDVGFKKILGKTKGPVEKAYKVSIIEKDTGCSINNIYISSFSDIKPYVERAPKTTPKSE